MKYLSNKINLIYQDNKSLTLSKKDCLNISLKKYTFAIGEHMEKKIKNSSTRIYGERIYLRVLQEEDASEEYCSWLNDPIVNKFLETKKSHK